MIRHEVYKFFLKLLITIFIDEIEVDNIFLDEMSNWNEEKGRFAFFLIDNYKKTYMLEFKKKIISYLNMIIFNPGIISQSDRVNELGPLILVKKIINEKDLYYQQTFDCLSDFTEYIDEYTAKKLIFLLIFDLS